MAPRFIERNRRPSNRPRFRARSVALRAHAEDRLDERNLTQRQVDETIDQGQMYSVDDGSGGRNLEFYLASQNHPGADRKVVVTDKPRERYVVTGMRQGTDAVRTEQERAAAERKKNQIDAVYDANAAVGGNPLPYDDAEFLATRAERRQERERDEVIRLQENQNESALVNNQVNMRNHLAAVNIRLVRSGRQPLPHHDALRATPFFPEIVKQHRARGNCELCAS